MRVQNAIALLPAELDCRRDNLARQALVSAFMAHSKPFQLGEIGKISNAHATDRFLALVANEVGRGEIVAVELLFERTLLFTHVDRAADSNHARQVLHLLNDSHRYSRLRT